MRRRLATDVVVTMREDAPVKSALRSSNRYLCRMACLQVVTALGSGSSALICGAARSTRLKQREAFLSATGRSQGILGRKQ